MMSWLRVWRERVLFEQSKTAVSGDIACHLRLCRGSISILYVGDVDELVSAPMAVPAFWSPLAALPASTAIEVLDPEAALVRKGDELLLYARIGLFNRWLTMPEDVDRMLQGRRQLTIVLLLPGLIMERVEDFRWILSALLDHFWQRNHDVVLTFSPSAPARQTRYIIAEQLGRLSASLRQPKRWIKKIMRSALSYDLVAGVRTDPDQFAALLISIRPKANAGCGDVA